MAAQVSKKRKFVADGVFKAELNEFLTRELAEDGYSGVEVCWPMSHLFHLCSTLLPTHPPLISTVNT